MRRHHRRAGRSLKRERQGHAPERWARFRRAWRDELARVSATWSTLLDYCRRGPITLLCGTRDHEYNQAVVLRELLKQEIAEEERPGETASPVCYGGDFPEDHGRS